MAHESVGNSTLVKSLGDLLGSFSDLVQKEIRLAKAELSEKLASKIQSTVWMAVAGYLGLLISVLVVEAAVFAIAGAGIHLYWACLIVAAVLAVAAAACFYHGRSLAEEDLAPRRALAQISQDIKTAKGQLT